MLRRLDRVSPDQVSAGESDQPNQYGYENAFNREASFNQL
jgi:hypothetical protein